MLDRESQFVPSTVARGCMSRPTRIFPSSLSVPCPARACAVLRVWWTRRIAVLWCFWSSRRHASMGTMCRRSRFRRNDGCIQRGSKMSGFGSLTVDRRR